jgi:peroxiredoxin Q/BCP
MALSVGDLAPNFTLAGDRGEVSLAALRGRPVVVYFYPKDDTSGCTREAIAFTALLPEFESRGAVVIGISPDGPKAHEKFRAKHALGVELASDPDKVALADYGVWVEKSMYGRSYMGVERATFLVDRDGRLAAIWRKVKVPGHAEAVLKALDALPA